MRIRKYWVRLWIFAILCLEFVLFKTYYYPYRHVFKKIYSVGSFSEMSIPPPVILLWTNYYDFRGEWLPSPAFLNCPVSDCIITYDRRLLKKSSAIVLHDRNVDLSDLPIYRTPYQRWVWLNAEAPPETRSDILKGLSWKINWTVSYRRDSDIYAPYGWFVRRKSSIPVPRPPSVDRKLVCWLVSHCETHSKREMFVHAMKDFVPVDIYGKCGDLRCPTPDRFECYRYFSKKYKFYLSFENSICKDYVTEKLFYALRTDMVPVVMGGQNYSDILPPNSYVDALSFDGLRQLAEYLLLLDKDEDKYLSYLAWKKDYKVVINGGFKWVCELCHKLHSNDTTIHGDLHQWFFQGGNCSTVLNKLKNK